MIPVLSYKWHVASNGPPQWSTYLLILLFAGRGPLSLLISALLRGYDPVQHHRAGFLSLRYTGRAKDKVQI